MERERVSRNPFGANPIEQSAIVMDHTWAEAVTHIRNIFQNPTTSSKRTQKQVPSLTSQSNEYSALFSDFDVLEAEQRAAEVKARFPYRP